MGSAAVVEVSRRCSYTSQALAQSTDPQNKLVGQKMLKEFQRACFIQHTHTHTQHSHTHSLTRQRHTHAHTHAYDSKKKKTHT